MGAFWTLFCSNSEGTSSITDPHSCLNNILVISLDGLLCGVFALILICKSFSKKAAIASSPSTGSSHLRIVAASLNTILSFSYLGFGIWIIFEELKTSQTVSPIHVWLVILIQGFSWLLLNLTIVTKKIYLPCIKLARSYAILSSLYAGFLFLSSIWEVFVEKEVSFGIILNALALPLSILLVVCAFEKHGKVIESNGFLYETFQVHEDNETIEIESDVTPFACAGFLSKMSFWWLNPLMKKGKHKILEAEDIPCLRREERAGTCYSIFMEQLMKQKKEEDSISSSSVVSAIFHCQWKEILISGAFAFVKVLTFSTGPLFLRAFILVAEGEETFKYEGYVLTAGLFSVKCLELLSERQWYFRTRLIGLHMRSFFSSAICQKQLKISSAAKVTHSPGEIVNYVTYDAYRIGELPYWFHQIWTTSLQLCLALAIVYYSVGLATFAALFTIVITVVVSSPLAKSLLEYQKKLVVAQNRRVKAIAESLGNMKVLKLYAWERHFKDVIQGLRTEESEWINATLTQKGYYFALSWSSPVLVPAVTFWACYLLGIPLTASNAFTFLASLRILQEPIKLIPDVLGAFIQAKVSLSRILGFLDAPELQNRHTRQHNHGGPPREFSVLMKSPEISWDPSSLKATLRNINLAFKPGEKVAICGEVGSGKSTLLAAILGEVPYVNGRVHVYGKMAYVSQTAWIQTGTIRENILFGSSMDSIKYQEALERCSLLKDIDMLPFQDMTVIGERGVNLSGGQKQRIQLARALYQDADVYLLDDPFSAVDAHTAASLFNEYVMGALSGKTILLVTHQVDFLPAFDSILLMSFGEILNSGSYNQLIGSCREFQDLVNAHKETNGSEQLVEVVLAKKSGYSKEEIQKIEENDKLEAPFGDQLIKKEETEVGDTGLKPYIQYLKHKEGVLYFTLAMVAHSIFTLGNVAQSYWLAAHVQNTSFSRVELNSVYTGIAIILTLFMFVRSIFVVRLGCNASESICAKLLESLYRAPMSFYDSTPLGRILSRVSLDLSIIDIDVAFRMIIALGTTTNTYFTFMVLVFLTWPVLFVIIPMIYLTIVLQKYYYASSRELVRIDGTTKSSVASYLAESIAGVITIRAFMEEDRFFSRSLKLIDANASSYFHNFSANEWLIQRLEVLCAIVLSSAALAITLLNQGSSASGYIGMELSNGLWLNMFLVVSVQSQCLLSNLIVSVERVEQYMHIQSEAPEVIEGSRPAHDWPATGNLKICNLKVRYRPDAPFILHGISCNIEGGHKVGIVGRTGSGKTTLISTLFRLVEPTEGKIIVDDLDISMIGLHDLRSHLGIIPQDPTLFGGTVRYNLDPLSENSDEEIWEVLGKCQLREAVQEKEMGLNSPVLQDGSNWSMGERQLFCLARILLRRRRILVLDEATASIDNATDAILQRTIRTEFADCTVITVAHKISTVMDCTMVLGMRDGRLVEYDEPMKLISKEDSLFGQFYKEYWSQSTNAGNFLED